MSTSLITDTTVTDGGETYAIDRVARRYAVCACTDGQHRTNRDPFGMHANRGQVALAARRQGAHVAVEYGYYFVGSVTA